MSEIEELKKDLEELRTLLSQVHRRKNKTLLSNQIAIIENKINNAPQEGVKDFTPTQSVAPVAAVFSPIERYGFDQDENQVNIYISLNGVSEKSEHSFNVQEQSLDFKLYNVERSGKNYRLAFAKLDGKVDTTKSRVTLKKDRVVIVLHKASERTWLQIPYQKQVGEDFDPEKDDVNQGIVRMMQDLYETGDERVKREIAKVWTKELGREERRN